jgi:hypothetical protein
VILSVILISNTGHEGGGGGHESISHGGFGGHESAGGHNFGGDCHSIAKILELEIEL